LSEKITELKRWGSQRERWEREVKKGWCKNWKREL